MRGGRGAMMPPPQCHNPMTMSIFTTSQLTYPMGKMLEPSSRLSTFLCKTLLMSSLIGMGSAPLMSDCVRSEATPPEEGNMSGCL